jgi:hypothetical protein
MARNREITVYERKHPIDEDLRDVGTTEYVVQCANSMKFTHWSSIYWEFLPAEALEFHKQAILSKDSPYFTHKLTALACAKAINKSKKYRARVIERVTVITESLVA